MYENTNAQEQAHEEQATKLYATRAECEANKPASASKHLRPFEISKNGAAVGWLWARGYYQASELVARRDGYTASLGGRRAPVTKEAVAAKLAEFSDEELAALGLTRKPQVKGKK
jgi:hypothetical protein